MLLGGPENRLRLSLRPRGKLSPSLSISDSFIGGLHDRMVSLFKFVLSRDRAENPADTAEVTAVAELSPATPRRAQPPPPVEAPIDDAQLKDFLLKNFLTAEPSEAVSAEVTVPPPTPAPAPPPASEPKPETVQESARQIAPEPEPRSEPISEAITLADLDEDKNVVADAELAAATAPPAAPKIAPHEWALEETLVNHKEWLDSHAAVGTKADLRNAKLQDTELIGVNLRYADLQDANLKSADLLLADLRDACLVRANLQESCLVGANLEGANLEGASLESAMGLLPRQLAGANLHEASLPAQIAEFSPLPEFVRTSNTAARLFSTTMALSFLSCLAIWKTKDIQLLADSAIIPYLHSSAASAAVPRTKSISSLLRCY